MESKKLYIAWAAAVALAASCSISPGSQRGTETTPLVEVAGVALVPADEEVHRECLALSRQVGYSLPCPRMLPEYATPYWGRPTGINEFFQAGNGSLRRWVWLSVNFVHRPETDDHLVISAAPTKVDARHLIFTPKPYPAVRLKAEGRLRFRGREATWFYVSQGETIYLGHTVLVWSERGRTYGVGFHGRGSAVRELGLAVARHLSFIR